MLHVYQSIFMLIQQGHFQKRDNRIFSKPTGRQQAVQDTLHDWGSDSIQSPLPPWKASEMLSELLSRAIFTGTAQSNNCRLFSVLSLECFLIFPF